MSVSMLPLSFSKHVSLSYSWLVSELDLLQQDCCWLHSFLFWGVPDVNRSKYVHLLQVPILLLMHVQVAFPIMKLWFYSSIEFFFVIPSQLGSLHILMLRLVNLGFRLNFMWGQEACLLFILHMLKLDFNHHLVSAVDTCEMLPVKDTKVCMIEWCSKWMQGQVHIYMH